MGILQISKNLPGKFSAVRVIFDSVMCDKLSNAASIILIHLFFGREGAVTVNAFHSDKKLRQRNPITSA
jgi:hypothetical protein